jgi:hypothetical protein
METTQFKNQRRPPVPNPKVSKENPFIIISYQYKELFPTSLHTKLWGELPNIIIRCLYH